MNNKLLGNLDAGLLFVVSAPAGTGKTTLVDMLVEEFPEAIAQSCSTTTRPPRSYELDRQHYEFISVADFEALIKKGDFLEHAKVFGNYYGTKKSEIQKHLSQKKHVILVIDTQGASQLIGKIDATFIFLFPPSFEELRLRLFKRRSEDEKKIQERLEWAKEEIKIASQYDYHIINDDLKTAYQVLRSILIATEHKTKRPGK